MTSTRERDQRLLPATVDFTFFRFANCISAYMKRYAVLGS